MSKPAKEATYRIRNWARYNRALLRRGSLTAWVDRESLDSRNHRGPARWRAEFVHGGTAIQCLPTLRAVFHPPLRATRGMAQSVFELMGLVLGVPTAAPSPGGPPPCQSTAPGSPEGRSARSWAARG